MSWRDQAACSGMDTRIFFPEQGRPDAAVTAKTICRYCPVQAACRAEAVARGERGIWGGTNDHERREIRQQESVA